MAWMGGLVGFPGGCSDLGVKGLIFLVQCTELQVIGERTLRYRFMMLVWTLVQCVGIVRV